MSRNQQNLWVDLISTVGVLVTVAPRFTGIPWHEWLSMLFVVVLVLHTVLHWRWVLEITTHFFQRLVHHTRFNYVLNFTLLAFFTILIGSGLMISESFMPLLGWIPAPSRPWRVLHRLTAEGIIWLTALHIALHWKWVVHALERYVLRPFLFRIGVVCKD